MVKSHQLKTNKNQKWFSRFRNIQK